MTHRSRVDLPTRVYRLCHIVFPAEYRRAHGEELLAFFAENYRAEVSKYGWRGGMRCLLRAIADVARHGATERLRALHHGMMWSGIVGTVRQDIGFTMRSIRKSPGFAIVTVLTIALGVGANSAIFSVVNTVLLKPLPYTEPDRLVTVWEANRALGMRRLSVSYPNFVAWRDAQQSFTSFGAVTSTSTLLRDRSGGETVRAVAASVTPSVFTVFAVRPVLGRTLVPEDADPGAQPVVVISHGLWQSRYGGDPDVIGRPLDGVRTTAIVVGIMPPLFTFPRAATDVWFPLIPVGNVLQIRSAHILGVVGRLAPGVTLRQAEQEIVTIAAGVEAAFPGEDPAHSAQVVPLDEATVANVSTALIVLLGAVGFVLLIACANVANLTLARATSRSREIALRVALGASRGRIIGQLVVEAVTVAVIAGVIGLGVAWWGVDLLVAQLPDTLPRAGEIGVDGSVLVFALVITLFTGAFTGIIPALRASRLDVSDELRNGTRGSDRGKPVGIRRALVVTEIALSAVLLVGAGLLINSFWQALSVDPGFEPDGLVTMTVTATGPQFQTRDGVVSFFEAIPEKLEFLPGVEAVSAVNALPVSGGDSQGQITVEGRSFQEGVAPAASFRRILPEYFRSMGIPIVRGRDFGPGDTGENLFVTIVDQALALRFWPDADPVGKRIKVGPPENEPWLTIVGVVGDVRNEGLDLGHTFATYEPLRQRPRSTMNVVVRTAGDPGVVAGAVRRALYDMAPDLAVYGTNTMHQRIRDSLLARRFQMLLLTVFAGVALFLAGVGIYGVMAYSVAQGSRSIGIRMALGATNAHVLRSVIRDGMGIVVVGAVIGLVLSVALSRSLASFVFGVSVLDPGTFAGVAVVLMGVALAASYIPAVRATRVNPVESLSRE